MYNNFNYLQVKKNGNLLIQHRHIFQYDQSIKFEDTNAAFYKLQDMLYNHIAELVNEKYSVLY